MHRSTPCRYFRTPPPLRAPPAATAVPPDGTSNSGTGNNGSRRDDDESKTDKSEKDGGIKKTSGQDGDENLFGELPITSSGAGENPGGAGRTRTLTIVVIFHSSMNMPTPWDPRIIQLVFCELSTR